MTILVITTGGTIGALRHADPSRPPRNVVMPPEGEDYVRDALAQPPLNRFATRCHTFEGRDSKFMDDAYRDKLFRLAEDAPERAVMITHGTDHLLVTAEYLFRWQPAKPIILTGAMVPLSNGAASEGIQNLAFALNHLSNNPPPGVFVVLSDGTPSDWHPRLYPFEPGRYEKFYDADGRYHRLRVIEP